MLLFGLCLDLLGVHLVHTIGSRPSVFFVISGRLINEIFQVESLICKHKMSSYIIEEVPTSKYGRIPAVNGFFLKYETAKDKF